MKAKIYSHRQLIGTADLLVGDEAMGGLFGEFIPNQVYFDTVQKSVWEYWRTNRPDYKKWHSLRFNAQLENGLFLFPEGGYTFEDIQELPNEPKRIDLFGVHSDIVQDYFLSNPPRPFVELPWNKIYIDQKIGLEDELRKELGIQNHSLFSFLTKPLKHDLADATFSAFCHNQRNDDVLFEIVKPNFDKRFALVHLTWKGKKEIMDYPFTKFFLDYDEFKYARMYPDKADWED